MNLRTDLALEANEMYNEDKNSKKLSGILSDTYKQNDILITNVEITSEEAARKLNKPVGHYVTMESSDLKTLNPEFTEKASYILKEQLEKLIEKNTKENVLIVGLGNRNITSDSLGPRVVSEIMVTRHLKEYMPEHIDDDIRPVSAISPGVLGLTGIETNDIISGIVKKTNPDLIIVIDALASKSSKRITTTIQITDTGINPGSGVGNNRKEISRKNLGIPVIAIGVPTVVDVISIAFELMPQNSVTDRIFDKFSKENEGFFVTPKDIDSIIGNISRIISNGINLALHRNIDLSYIEAFRY